VPLTQSDKADGIKAMYLEVLEGLQASPKRLPSKFFYDETGSRLFDAICELDEYYLTRTELSIMDACMEEICAAIGPRAMLIEYGSGSSEKIRRILDAPNDIRVYVPIDISCRFLQESAARIARRYPHIEVRPVCADFSRPFSLPHPRIATQTKTVYFPGSTIGNFHPDEAVAFLKNMAEIIGPGSSLIIGVDLQKEQDILHAAYNDARGITARFNLNQLVRFNRELGSDFDLRRFEHQALYNPQKGRVEMHIVSTDNQTVHINGATIPFRKGETIWTESSYKYTVEGFRKLAARAGFEPVTVWCDAQHFFSIHHLRVTR